MLSFSRFVHVFRLVANNFVFVHMMCDACDDGLLVMNAATLQE